MNERAEAPNANLHGALNGVTHVTVMPASIPIGGSLSPTNVAYRIGTISIYNADTAGVTVRLFINEGSGTRYQLVQVAIAAAASYSTVTSFPHGLLVKGPEFLEANLTAGPATTNPNFYTTWVELRT